MWLQAFVNMPRQLVGSARLQQRHKYKAHLPTFFGDHGQATAMQSSREFYGWDRLSQEGDAALQN